jgi:hypothetical protein
LWSTVDKDSGQMSFLGCVALAVFVGAVNAREECTGPHLCADLDKSVAHNAGGLSTLQPLAIAASPLRAAATPFPLAC